MKRGKKYNEAAKKVNSDEKLTVEAAVKKLKELSYAKFNETVEVHIRLNVDPRNAEQQVRGTVVLPHGIGKNVRVLVFAQGDEAIKAKEAGAEFVGAEDLAEKINGGWTDFDAAIATPDMMRVVGKLGKVLGPKGLMPNPKTGTVTKDVERAVREAKAGKVEYRVDRFGIIHCVVGKIQFSYDQLLENLKMLLDAVLKARPSAVKGQYIKSIAICGTMTPSVRIEYEKAAAA